MIDPIEAHYDAFPYPQVRSMVLPCSPTHTIGVLNGLLRRRAHDALTTRPSLWVAGCGTLQGTTWAKLLPEARVLATDVSQTTLAHAAALASRLGADNVRFQRHDLRDAAPDGPFDFIVCTGVVHHLPDPAAGLRRLREALAPGGAAFVMVYSHAHRAPLDPIRRAALALSHAHPDPYPIACRVLGAALQERAKPLGREVLASLWQLRDHDRSFVADVLLNPRETSYRVDELPKLFGDAGLRFVEWLHPGTWRLGLYVDDDELAARAAALGPLGEAAVVQQLAGLASPLLEALVERDDAPPRRPYARAEKLASPLLLSGGARELDLDGAMLRGERYVPPFVARDGMLTGTARAGQFAPGRVWMVPDALRPLLEGCDGTRTLAALGRAHGVDDDTLVTLYDALGPRDVGLLAPA